MTLVIHVTLTCLNIFIATYHGQFYIYLCVGESVYSSLHGSSVDVNVRLERNSVKLENTYIGLCTQRYMYMYIHDCIYM